MGRRSAGELWNAGNFATAGGLGSVECAIAKFQQAFEGKVVAVDRGDADAGAKAELDGVRGTRRAASWVASASVLGMITGTPRPELHDPRRQAIEQGSAVGTWCILSKGCRVR